MSLPVVLATGNAGKVAELREILGQLPVTLLDGNDVDLPEVEETGDTFAANALLKAHQTAQATGLPCVADDSGLVVDALGGEPGIFSARYAGPQRDDAANLDLVLSRLKALDQPSAQSTEGSVAADALPRGGSVTFPAPQPRKTTDHPEGAGPGWAARFVCAAALALPDGREHVVEAAMEGTIVMTPRGDNGFGYDPIFQPLGHTQTTAEMSPADKHAISHRGKAFRSLRPHLADLVTDI